MNNEQKKILEIIVIIGLEKNGEKKKKNLHSFHFDLFVQATTTTTASKENSIQTIVC